MLEIESNEQTDRLWREKLFFLLASIYETKREAKEKVQLVLVGAEFKRLYHLLSVGVALPPTTPNYPISGLLEMLYTDYMTMLGETYVYGGVERVADLTNYLGMPELHQMLDYTLLQAYAKHYDCPSLVTFTLTNLFIDPLTELLRTIVPDFAYAVQDQLITYNSVEFEQMRQQLAKQHIYGVGLWGFKQYKVGVSTVATFR